MLSKLPLPALYGLAFNTGQETGKVLSSLGNGWCLVQIQGHGIVPGYKKLVTLEDMKSWRFYDEKDMKEGK